MSLSFDLVINCDLREDTPEDAIEAIKYLTQPDYTLKQEPQLTITDPKYPDVGNMWDTFGSRHFLVPDPDHNIICNFRRVHRLTIPLENNREVYRYRLQYCGSLFLDDYFFQFHLPFVYWLATVAYENYIGYYMETHGGGLGVQHLRVENGLIQS
jgi:hypothetical protein